MARGGTPAPGAAVVVLPDLLRQLPASERRQEVYRHVCDVVRRVFGVDPSFALDPQQGLLDLGFDSLMAVELRNVLPQRRPVVDSEQLAFDYPSIDSQAQFLPTLLSAESADYRPHGCGAPAVAAPVDASGEVRDLSDEEAEALLAEELNK